MKTILTLLIFCAPFFVDSQNIEELAYYCVPCNSGCDDKTFTKPGKCDHCGMALQRMTAKEREMQMNGQLTIAFYLQHGVEVLDFAGPMEVFAYAGYNVFTVSKTTEPIVSQGILKIVPDYSIDNAPEADILDFIGGNSGAASGDKEVIQWVKNQENIEYHFSVCTGAFVLAESDILKWKTVTTFHNSIDNLKTNYPEANVLDNVRFVDNGKVITTAGISAGIDGALHLVAKLYSLAEAKWIAYYMEYDKWKPGEDLILSDDNTNITNQTPDNNYKAYEGTYEMDNKVTAEVIYETDSKSLVAVIEGKRFPLFQNAKNEFLTVGRDLLTFNWVENKVTGYTSDEGTFYRKLD